MLTIPFIKASALGNDFVIVPSPFPTDFLSSLSLTLADRRHGIGCDQVIFATIEKGHCSVSFYNTDGSKAMACGNGTRAVALWAMQQTLKDEILIKTASGDIACHLHSETNTIRASFTEAITYKVDPICIHLNNEDVSGFYVNVGNPHFVFFTEDIGSIHAKGPLYAKIPHQYNCSLEDTVNVQAVRVVNAGVLEACSYERGVGVTPSCGTGAIASFLAIHHASCAFLKPLNRINVIQAGGTLVIEKTETGIDVYGDASIIFHGTIPLTIG